MDTNERLERWIEQTVFSGVNEITSLILFHANVKRGDRLLKIDLTPDINASDIVVKIIATAEDDSMGLGGGTQRYIVRAQNKREKLVGRFAFVIQGDEDEENGIETLDSEPATSVGLVKQAMRHLEASERTHILATNSIIATQARIIQRQQEHIETLEQRHVNQLDTHAKLVMQEHEREIELTTATLAEERKDRMVKEFLPLASMAASSIMSKYLGDGSPASKSPDPRMQAFITFIKSLEQKEIMGILNSVAPMKRAAIMTLLKELADEEDNKDSEEK